LGEITQAVVDRQFTNGQEMIQGEGVDIKGRAISRNREITKVSSVPIWSYLQCVISAQNLLELVFSVALQKDGALRRQAFACRELDGILRFQRHLHEESFRYLKVKLYHCICEVLWNENRP